MQIPRWRNTRCFRKMSEIPLKGWYPEIAASDRHCDWFVFNFQLKPRTIVLRKSMRKVETDPNLSNVKSFNSLEICGFRFGRVIFLLWSICGFHCIRLRLEKGWNWCFRWHDCHLHRTVAARLLEMQSFREISLCYWLWEQCLDRSSRNSWMKRYRKCAASWLIRARPWNVRFSSLRPVCWVVTVTKPDVLVHSSHVFHSQNKRTFYSLFLFLKEEIYIVFLNKKPAAKALLHKARQQPGVGNKARTERREFSLCILFSFFWFVF